MSQAPEPPTDPTAAFAADIPAHLGEAGAAEQYAAGTELGEAEERPDHAGGANGATAQRPPAAEGEIDRTPLRERFGLVEG